MFSQRDRMLAALFVVQLIAAVAFGGLLIHTLHTHSNNSSERVLSEGRAGSGGLVSNGGSGGGSGNGGSNGTTNPSNPGGGSNGATTGPGLGDGGNSTGNGGSSTGNGVSSNGNGGNSTGKGGNSTGNGNGGNSTGKGGNSTGNGNGNGGNSTGNGGTSTSKGTIAAGAPIKVGSIVTETGGINFAASAQATEAYIDQVDASGGVNGHQIQLLLQDDQESASRGESEAQAMIDEGVFSFMGWNAPLTEDSIVPLLAKNKIPLVGCYGEYAEYHSPWSYAFSASYGHYGYEMGKYLMSLGVKKPGLIYIDNGEADANNGLVSAFDRGVEAGGGTVSSNDIFKEQPEQPTYDNVVTSLRLNGVDGIATILDEASYNRLQSAEQGQSYNPTQVADPLWPDDKVTTHEDGTYVATDFNFVNPGVGGAVGDYVSTVQKQFGSSAQISYIGEQGWLDAEIFVDALKQLGPTGISRPALMNVLDKLNVKDGYGFTGPLLPTTSAHDINHCLEFGKWTGDAVEKTTNWICDNQPF